MVPPPVAMQVSNDGGGGLSAWVTGCAAKVAAAGARATSGVVSSAVHMTGCPSGTCRYSFSSCGDSVDTFVAIDGQPAAIGPMLPAAVRRVLTRRTAGQHRSLRGQGPAGSNGTGPIRP